MIQIRNNNQLTDIFQLVATNVISVVGEKMKESLHEYINQMTYEVAQSQYPREWYSEGTKQPTYEFREAFKLDEIERNIDGVVAHLFYDWMSMTLGTTGKDGNYIHTQDGDFRERMAEAFNVDAFVYGDFPTRARQREPYWDTFITVWFDVGMLEDEFSKELAKWGFHIGGTNG